MFGIGVAFLLVTTVCFVASVLRYPKKFAAYSSDPPLHHLWEALPMGFNTLTNYLYYLNRGEIDHGDMGVLVDMSGVIVFYGTFLTKKESSSNYLIRKTSLQLFLFLVSFTVPVPTANLWFADLPFLKLQDIMMVVSYIL